MKTAEREINRVSYAFEILEKAGFPINRISSEKKSEEEDKKEGPSSGVDKDVLIAINMDDLPKIKTLEGREERVLITNVFNSKYEGWHPTLGEFDLTDPNAPKVAKGEKVVRKPEEEIPKYSESQVILKIKDIAPLTFESNFIKKEKEEEKKE